LSDGTGGPPPFFDGGVVLEAPPVLDGGMVSPVTVKLELLDAFPAGVLTEIRPVMAPGGTVAEIESSALIVNVDGTPWNVTAVVPEKRTPETVMVLPTGPLIGVTFAISGRNTVAVRRVIARSYDVFAVFPAARRT